jgi:hypothetical protein
MIGKYLANIETQIDADDSTGKRVDKSNLIGKYTD